MATLKISDLSVGDWVQDNYDNYIKVAGIWQDGNLNYQVDILRDGVIATIIPCNIYPIPITAEILKKNGFSNNGEKWYTPELFTLERWSDNWDIVIACSCGDYVCEVCTIKYVHQLQHALRLAGVDKEINL